VQKKSLRVRTLLKEADYYLGLTTDESGTTIAVSLLLEVVLSCAVFLQDEIIAETTTTRTNKTLFISNFF
jgi:hypothetical protein